MKRTELPVKRIQDYLRITPIWDEQYATPLQENASDNLPQYPFREYPQTEKRPFSNAEIVDELFGMKVILDNLVQATRSKSARDATRIIVPAGLTDRLMKKTIERGWSNNPELATTFQNRYATIQVLEAFLNRVAVSAEKLLEGKWTVSPHYDPFTCEFTLSKKQ